MLHRKDLSKSLGLKYNTSIMSTVILTSVVTLIVCVSVIDGFKEYCETETFKAKCPTGQVVTMTEARYGRMRKGRCVETAERGCVKNVKHIMDGYCSGRSSCEVSVSVLIKQSVLKQCRTDLRFYLEAEYNCTKALPRSSADCDGTLSVTSSMSPLYISSNIAKSVQCAYQNKPITIAAKPGQYLSIKILDFTVELSKQDQPDTKCEVYGVIKDTSMPENPETICGGRTHTEHVMTTIANEVQIRTMQRKNISFLLKINVLGCPDPPLTTTTKLTRSLNRAEVSCPGNDVVRTLDCVNGQWIGEFKNCSESFPNVQSDASVMKGITLSEELSILIITMVALLVGIFVLAVGVICLKRYSHQRLAQPAETTQEYWPPPPPELAQDVMYKPSEDTDMSNKYYRTWQLQQHSSNVSQNSYPPPYSSNTSTDMFTDNSNKRNNGQHPVEHIYESPKFDTDSVYSAPERITTGSTSSYFDLDPGVTIHPSNIHVRGPR